jgi:hypothetical protein
LKNRALKQVKLADDRAFKPVSRNSRQVSLMELGHGFQLGVQFRGNLQAYVELVYGHAILQCA